MSWAWLGMTPQIRSCNLHNVANVAAFPLHYQCLDFVLHQSAHDTQSILKLQCAYIGNWSLTVVSTGVTLVVGMCLGLGFEACSTTQPCEPKVTMTAAQPRFNSSRPARPASSTDATLAPVSSSAWERKQCCVSQNVCVKINKLYKYLKKWYIILHTFHEVIWIWVSTKT